MFWKIAIQHSHTLLHFYVVNIPIICLMFVFVTVTGNLITAHWWILIWWMKWWIAVALIALNACVFWWATPLKKHFDFTTMKTLSKISQRYCHQWFNWVDHLITLSFQILGFFHSSGFMEYDCSAKLQKEKSTTNVHRDKI